MGAHMRTVRSRRLASELKHLREGAGLTGDQVAEEMGWSGAKVYRIEGDKVRVLVRDVTRLLRLYEIDGPHREAVLELARQARMKDWWHQYSGAIPEWFQFYVGLEAAASAMHGYDAELVTGLLQTEDYARAIMSTAPERAAEDAERQMAVRMERRKRLTAADPLELWEVVNEAVVRREVGGSEVMRGQLRHLLEMSALGNVTVQVLAYDAGAHTAMHGSFTVMQFPEQVDPDVVYLEAQTGALYLEKTEDVRRYSLMFDYLRAQALSPEASRDLMTRLANEM
ncbi:MAG TPA: helix-turn-helix transcriptional regulator [Streptosporangiaceae bacterium]